MNQNKIESGEDAMTRQDAVQPYVKTQQSPSPQTYNNQRNIHGPSANCVFCSGYLRVQRVPGLKTWFWGCCLFAFCGAICGLIPCCIDSTKDMKYICNKCNKWNYTIQVPLCD